MIVLILIATAAAGFAINQRVSLAAERRARRDAQASA